MMECFKKSVRETIDLTARLDNQDFLIAMPGATQQRAEEIALQLKADIIAGVKTPGNLPVEVAVGVTEYAVDNAETETAYASTAEEVATLIKMTAEKSVLQKLT